MPPEVVERRVRTRIVAAHRRVGDALAAVAELLDVVVLAFDLELGQGELHALRVVRAEVVAELGEQIVGGRIGDRARLVHADAAAVAVPGHAAVDVRPGQVHVEIVLLVRPVDADLVHGRIVLELARSAQIERVLVAFLGRRLRDVVEGVVWKPISELDTLLVHVVPPKVEEEPEEEETTAEEAAASEAGGEPDAEKKTDEGEASDGDK